MIYPCLAPRGLAPRALVARGLAFGVSIGLTCALGLIFSAPVLADAPVQCQRPATSFDTSIPAAQKQLGYARLAPLANGRGVSVAVIDTGVDASVPQLAGRVTDGVDLTGSGMAAATDCLGRGTALAAIVAAGPTRGAAFVGMAPQARIAPVRVTSGDGREPTPELIAAGIKAAADGGMRIALIASANLPVTPVLTNALNYAASRDMVVVAPEPAPETPPSGIPPAPLVSDKLLTVNSLNDDGTLQTPAATASGTPAAGPDLVAPGGKVLSLARRGAGTVVGSGNAYAAAFVAGAAALVRSHLPTLTAGEVIQRLEQSAIGVNGGRPFGSSGWGLVDPYDAVAAELPGARAVPTTSPQPLLVAVPAVAAHPERQRALLGLAAVGLVALLLLARTITARARRRPGPRAAAG
ncbi:MAG: peptidase and in, kexin, sedolisin [Frankiales bacterium]|nr:peptidase and in, kexin, sedolisin [Frankiales bacterium]